MLTRMRLENFKSWEDTGDVALKPITCFFGPNSSGKTSLIQALLMLKQTAVSRDQRTVFHFGDSRSIVNLGDYESVIHGHHTGRSLGVSLGWKAHRPFEVVDTETDDRVVSDDTIGFHVSAREIESRSRKEVVVEEMAHTVGKAQFGMRRGSRGRYQLFASGVDFKFARQRGRPRNSLRPLKCYGFPGSMWTNFRNIDFLADLEIGLEERLDSVYYLGPVRAYPERSYTWSGAQPTDMGEAGQSVVDAIIASRELGEMIGQGRGRPRLTLEGYVAQWLKRLGLIHEFRVVPLTESSRIFEVRVRKSAGSSEVLLTDVGFGVSQILPVLVMCFYVPMHSTVILEQPEIHLHPLAQAGLADVFIDALRRRRIQILLESHSEHLLNRLQRRIAEEGIHEHDAALYFCSDSEVNGSRLVPLELDEYGNIRNWPKNFFGDQFGEISAMRKAGLRRRMNDG